MKKGLKIFQLFGIDIFLHYSWWLIFIFLTWSLSSGFFPYYFKGLTAVNYWLMGLISSLSLFISVLLHELSHSLVARSKKVKVTSITLFFFGGVANITDEDLKPSTEFFMSIAGPLFSFFLGGIFFLIYKLDLSGFLTAITFYLYQLNLILGFFNLVPGYPLDGGRAFRALLYAYFKDLKKATRIASFAGKFFAAVIFFLGIFGLAMGTGGGLWFILIGGFLYFLAGAGNDQVVVKEALSKIKISELLNKKNDFIDAEMTFRKFLKKYGSESRSFYLVKSKNFQGIFDFNRFPAIKSSNYQEMKLRQVSLNLDKVVRLDINDTAYSALLAFNEKDVELLPIAEKKKKIGFIYKQALINRLNLELRFGKK